MWPETCEVCQCIFLQFEKHSVLANIGEPRMLMSCKSSPGRKSPYLSATKMFSAKNGLLETQQCPALGSQRSSNLSHGEGKCIKGTNPSKLIPNHILRKTRAKAQKLMGSAKQEQRFASADSCECFQIHTQHTEGHFLSGLCVCLRPVVRDLLDHTPAVAT